MGFLKVMFILLVVAGVGLGIFYLGANIALGHVEHPVNATKIDDGITMTFVSSTEYYFGDLGKTIIQILDRNQNRLNGTCNQTILYHNGSIFLKSPMTSVDLSGNYYDLFTIPFVDGVYTVNVECLINYNSITRTMFNSKTFHVSNATKKILETIQQNSSTILNNIVNNAVLTEQVLYITNDTNYYLHGHIDEHLDNISANLSVLSTKSNIIISIANSTYNLIRNNMTQSFITTINLSRTINNTVYQNSLNLLLIEQFLGIKPFNMSIKVYHNEVVYTNQIWLVQAEVRDQYNRIISNANCTISSPLFGIKPMIYIPAIKRYELQRMMNQTGDSPFSVSCSA